MSKNLRVRVTEKNCSFIRVLLLFKAIQRLFFLGGGGRTKWLGQVNTYFNIILFVYFCFKIPLKYSNWLMSYVGPSDWIL